jgi:hypothetical protein
LGLLLELLAATGLRISEALALRLGDLVLDGERTVVCVRRAHVRGAFKPPKSKYGRRQVPIDDGLVKALRRRSRGEADSRALVFPGPDGGPLHPSNLLMRVFKPAAEQAGVSWAGFHTLRHTCASRLFAEGRNAVQVQRWLGHSDPGFTLRTYVHLLNDDLGEPLAGPSKGVSRVSAGHTPLGSTAVPRIGVITPINGPISDPTTLDATAEEDTIRARVLRTPANTGIRRSGAEGANQSASPTRRVGMA